MRRCLMATDLVRHPGTLGVKSPPDRSVSLPDPRDTAVSMMGFGGVGGSAIGNLRLKQLQKQRRDLVDRYEALAPDAPNAPYNQERDTLLDEIDEVERLIREEEPPEEPPPSAPVETVNVSDPAVRKVLLERLGRRHLGPAPDLPPDTAAMVAEGEPPRIGRAHPERPSAPYEPLPELTEEERKRGKKAIDKIREDNAEGLNPESRMDAQFLPGLFAQMAEQENRGYFGDVGEFVGNMSTEQKIALLIAVGALTGGASTPMLGPALAGGAGLAFANQ